MLGISKSGISNLDMSIVGISNLGISNLGVSRLLPDVPTSILGIVFLTPPIADSITLDMSCGRITPSKPCNSTIVPLPQSSNILPAMSRLPPALFSFFTGVASGVGVGSCPLTGSTYTGVPLSAPLADAIGFVVAGFSLSILARSFFSASSAATRSLAALSAWGAF